MSKTTQTTCRDRLAANLKSLREKHGFTQVELGKSLGGYAVTTISRWERGDRTPSFDDLDVLADLYDVDVSRFFRRVS